MQRTSRNLLRIFGAFTLSAAFILSAFMARAADVVCRSPGGIAGFGDEYAKAERHIGPNTHSIDKIDVYISVTDETLYLHSNYVTSGFDVSTKIATESNVDLLTLVLNLVGPEEWSGVSETALRQQIRKIRFYVEQNVFSATKFKALKIEEAQNLLILDESGIARRTMRIPNESGGEQLVMEFQRSLYAKLNEPNVATLNGLYRSLAFSRRDVRLLPLTVDSSTVDLIGQKIPESNRISFDLSSKEALDRSLSSHKNTTLFPLGHIENDSFVVRDAGNNLVFEISLTELEATAKKYNITVFALGCNSAKTTRTAGVLNTFNTVDAVNRFHKGLNESNTYIDFFDKLASDDVFILLDPSLLGRERLNMKIYSGGRRYSGGAGDGGGDNGGGGDSLDRRAGTRPAPRLVGRMVLLNPNGYRSSSYLPVDSSPSPTPSGALGGPSSGPSSTTSNEDNWGWWILSIVALIAVAGAVWGVAKSKWG